MSAPVKVLAFLVAWLWLASSGSVPGPGQVLDALGSGEGVELAAAVDGLASAGRGAGRASGDYADLFNSAGNRHGVDPALLSAIGYCESRYNPWASSGKADGLMQFRPVTASEYGVDVWDPASSIDGAARYLVDSIAHLGTRDPALLAASYNAGRYGSAVEAGRVPQNGETPDYVECVTGRL